MQNDLVPFNLSDTVFPLRQNTFMKHGIVLFKGPGPIDKIAVMPLFPLFSNFFFDFQCSL